MMTTPPDTSPPAEPATAPHGALARLRAALHTAGRSLQLQDAALWRSAALEDAPVVTARSRW